MRWDHIYRLRRSLLHPYPFYGWSPHLHAVVIDLLLLSVVVVGIVLQDLPSTHLSPRCGYYYGLVRLLCHYDFYWLMLRWVRCAHYRFYICSTLPFLIFRWIPHSYKCVTDPVACTSLYTFAFCCACSRPLPLDRAARTHAHRCRTYVCLLFFLYLTVSAAADAHVEIADLFAGFGLPVAAPPGGLHARCRCHVAVAGDSRCWILLLLPTTYRVILYVRYRYIATLICRVVHGCQCIVLPPVDFATFYYSLIFPTTTLYVAFSSGIVVRTLIAI